MAEFTEDAVSGRIAFSDDLRVCTVTTPDAYTIDLENEIDEVVSAELVSIEVPVSRYLINLTNATFVVNAVTVTLAHGAYDDPAASALVTALGAAVAAAVPSMTVSLDAVTRLVTFAVGSADPPFSLSFPLTSNLHSILGFRPSETYVSGDGADLVAPYPINTTPLHYIVISIGGMNVIKSANSVLDNSTAVITSNAIATASLISTNITKRYNPVKASVRRITVNFKDYYGNAYDFQNQEHYIELLFRSRKNLMRFSL
ncbi:hypothetical protein FOA52_004821 [Chlamydomonas sp. UWO 241]|nr:hypothetical protein FOA52_004821 [Chlamydomonas sp. UWO 241]